MSEFIQRNVFEAPSFTLENGRTIPLCLGYETYGTLNEAKDNAVLVPHPFSQFGHAAGVYSPDDAMPGYWDGLIGPGKGIDTSRYFVISPDSLCCIPARNPLVKTTGPMTINAATGKPYGLRFPVVTMRDIARTQKLLVESLGITRLHAAAGASMGGMIAMHLALDAPSFVGRLLGVVTSPVNPLPASMQFMHLIPGEADPAFNHGDYYDGHFPVKAMTEVTENLIINAYTPRFIENLFPRSSADESAYQDINNKMGFEAALEEMARSMSVYSDYNSWIYSCRITAGHNIARGHENMKEALAPLTAATLLISNQQDSFEPPPYSKTMVKDLKELGKQADFVLFDDPFGHMAAFARPDLFSDKVKAFLC
jgi:homoserine O-acetyltransferase